MGNVGGMWYKKYHAYNTDGILNDIKHEAEYWKCVILCLMYYECARSYKNIQFVVGEEGRSLDIIVGSRSCKTWKKSCRSHFELCEWGWLWNSA